MLLKFLGKKNVKFYFKLICDNIKLTKQIHCLEQFSHIRITVNIRLFCLILCKRHDTTFARSN